MSSIHRVRSALLAASIGIAAIAPAAADEIVLNIPGVSGTVQIKGFADDIELTAYSQEFTDPATVSSLGGGGRGAGGNRTTCGAISIAKLVDKTSPKFLEFVARGETIPNATLYFIKSTGESVTVPYTIALTRLRLTSITQGDTLSNAAGLTENITMIAETFQFTFFVTNPATGAATAAGKFGWNCVTDRAF